MEDERELCRQIGRLLEMQGRDDSGLEMTPQTSLAQDGLALTSLELVRLLVGLEEELGVELDDMAVMNAVFDTVGDLVDLVHESRSLAEPTVS